MGYKISCDYCGEESNHVPIIQKPHNFILDDRSFLFAQSYTDLSKNKVMDYVCLECLVDELDALEECY